MGNAIWKIPASPPPPDQSSGRSTANQKNAQASKKVGAQAEMKKDVPVDKKQSAFKYNPKDFAIDNGNTMITVQIDEKKIGVPHIDNIYWQMVRSSKTKSLATAFKNQLITCNDVIVVTSGHTIVHESVVLNRREYLKLCEVYGADWDQGDLNGVTALMKAVALNRVYFVQRLLELGANKDIKDKRGMTAMDYGRLYDSFDSIDKLNEVGDGLV